VHLFRAGIRTPPQLLIFAGALTLLYVWRSKAAVALVVLGAAILGLLLGGKA
jgi:hypothetical protein